ncbi:MAG: hypothetical protein ACXQS5_06295 [Candidatus Methanospirareceae archaeon]
MNRKYDGGPAFPVVCDGDPCIILRSEGMSLRDYFAGLAMQAIIDDDTSPTTAANWSYQYADAMLVQKRSK